MICPIIIAFWVYNKPNGPKNPLLEMKEYTKSPITTVGKERSVLRTVIRNRFPLNSFKAMTSPSGTPAKADISVEKKLTLRDTEMMFRSSASRDHKRRRADLKLSRKKVILSFEKYD